MPKVLIVDDRPETRETFSSLLRLEGYDTKTAEDGGMGIVSAVRGPFDLILVDLRLPDMSGIDVVRELRRRGLNVPIVIVTAFPDIHSSFEAGHAGASRYVEGPLIGDELSFVVRQTLETVTDERISELSPPKPEVAHTDSGRSDHRRADPRIREIVNAIQLDPGISLSALASRVGLSESRLRHVFGDVMGVSFSEYRREQQLTIAARLLRSSPALTKQIADRIGLSELRRTFRARFGMSPQAYRSTFYRRQVS